VLSHPRREKQKRCEDGDQYPYTIRENVLLAVTIIAVVVTIFPVMAGG